MSNVRDLVEKVTSLPGYTAQLSGGAEKSNSSTLLVAVDRHAFPLPSDLRPNLTAPRD